MASRLAFASIALVVLVAALYAPIKHRLDILGVFRVVEKVNVDKCRSIPLIQCEDIHVHNGLAYTACEGSHPEGRTRWFPPMALFHEPDVGHGGLFVIDPDTLEHTRLELVGFNGPFSTHGIGTWFSPSAPNELYIFAVNHLPNPNYVDDVVKNSPVSSLNLTHDSFRNIPRARSQIEIFEIALPADGTVPSTAKHVASVHHPLIRTPNDIVPTGPRSFYVTNDHYYREGHLRLIEDVGQSLTPWSDIVHVDASRSAVEAEKVMTGLHNNNGLARGKGDEIICCSAAGGMMYRLKPKNSTTRELTLLETVQMQTPLDNPHYFSHGPVSHHAYYLAGYPKTPELLEGHLDLSVKISGVVWRLKENGPHNSAFPAGGNKDRWTTEVVFEDDGSVLSSSSIAAVVPIEGTDEGRVLISGPWSQNIAVCRLRL